MKDGESDGKGGRWCAGCGRSHGDLYVCPKYPPGVKQRLEAMGARFRDNLRDPAWVAEQRRNGIPEIAIEAMGMFAGVKPGSGRPS